MAAVVERLIASSNVCDNRKGSDLNELLVLSRERWRNRCRVVQLGSTPEGGLAIVCQLQVAGLTWSDGQAVRRDAFRCTIGIANTYPMSMPDVRFLDPVPWCGHVVHRDSLPEASGLPPQLQDYLRQGHGRCCYLRSSQWTPAKGTLVIVLWQVSRLIAFGKGWAEAASLNPAARDHALRLARQPGRLPLGKPLPCPRIVDSQSVRVAPADGTLTNDGDIEWGNTIEEATHDWS